MSKTQPDKNTKTSVSEQKETTRSQPASNATQPGRVPDLKQRSIRELADVLRVAGARAEGEAGKRS
jgi:hypothetical protein